MPTRFVAIVVLLLAGAGALTACEESAERNDAGAVVEAGKVDAFSLQPGDCFNDADNPDEVFTSLKVVPCSDLHDNEIFATFNYPAGDDEDFPGDAAISAFGIDACVTAFESFVGARYEDSALDFDFIVPTRESWTYDDDRELLCYLWQMDLAKLRGSMEGSGR